MKRVVAVLAAIGVLVSQAASACEREGFVIRASVVFTDGLSGVAELLTNNDNGQIPLSGTPVTIPWNKNFRLPANNDWWAIRLTANTSSNRTLRCEINVQDQSGVFIAADSDEGTSVDCQVRMI